MKKITFQKTVIKALVSLAGCMATLVVALFMDDIYGVIATLMIGGGITALINDQL